VTANVELATDAARTRSCACRSTISPAHQRDDQSVHRRKLVLLRSSIPANGCAPWSAKGSRTRSWCRRWSNSSSTTLISQRTICPAWKISRTAAPPCRFRDSPRHRDVSEGYRIRECIRPNRDHFDADVLNPRIIGRRPGARGGDPVEASQIDRPAAADVELKVVDDDARSYPWDRSANCGAHAPGDEGYGTSEALPRPAGRLVADARHGWIDEDGYIFLADARTT